MTTIAHLLDIIPKRVSFFFASVCIRDKYVDFARKILNNDPKPLPKLVVKTPSSLRTFCDVRQDSFELLHYDSWAKLNFDKNMPSNF